MYRVSTDHGLEFLLEFFNEVERVLAELGVELTVVKVEET